MGEVVKLGGTPPDDDGCELHGSLEAPLTPPIKDHRKGRYVESEYLVIAGEMGAYKRLGQALLNREGKMIDRIVVATLGGARHVFYFDVTEPLLASGKELGKAYEKMKAKGLIPPELDASSK